MKQLLIFVALLWPSLAFAQPGPGTFTRVKSTNTTATSMCVGCPATTVVPAANSGITAATVVLPSGVPSVTTDKLYSSGGALVFNGLSLATGSSISGTTGTLPKFTAVTTLGDSIVSELTGTITIAGILQTNGTVTTGTNGAAGLYYLNGPTATDRDIRIRTAGVDRWIIRANSTAEAGANAGSNFQIFGMTDAGSLIGTALQFTRSSLAATFGGALTVTGTSALNAATTVATSFQLTGAAPVYLGNTNNGYLFRNSTNGATLLGITDAGAISLPGVATFTAQPILSSLTASLPVFTDGSKGLVSNTMTGTGSVVMSASPTLTGTLTAAAFTQSGTARLGTASTTAGWGVLAAGDWTIGATNIADSSGVPTISSGFGGGSATIAGRDYAMRVTAQAASHQTGTVAFGHTWTTAPLCFAFSQTVAENPVLVSTTTTAAVLTYTVNNPGNATVYTMLCRSY